MPPEPASPAAFQPLFGSGAPFLSFLRAVGIERPLALLRGALAGSADIESDLRVLLSASDNWRPHLVAAAAIVLAPERCPLDALWARIERGSWVLPQLLVAAQGADPESFGRRGEDYLGALLSRVVEGEPTTRLWGYAKNATAVVALLGSEPEDPRHDVLASADQDDGGQLALDWRDRMHAAIAAPPGDPPLATPPPRLTLWITQGDLLDQHVDAIVNAWNRNVIPWWLLIPQGVSAAIKRRAGYAPFSELGWAPMPLGSARATSAGRLPFKAIIHVAGIDMLWRASAESVRPRSVS